MAGLIGAALAGATEGFGTGVAKAAGKWQEHEFAKERDEILGRRQEALARMGMAHQSAEAEKTRTHQTGLAEMTNTRIQGEGSATRQLQRELAETQERGASARHGASTSIALAQLKATQEQVHLLPQADGTFQRVRKDGTVLGVAMDPTTNKPLVGPKDVAASTKILVETNGRIIAALAKDAGEATAGPAKDSILAQINSLKQENQRLLGIGGTTAPSAATPEPGDIAGLKARARNPQAIAAFEAKFGPGSAERYLGKQQNAATATAPPQPRRGGLANVLDEQRPRPLSPGVDITEEDRMLYP